MIFKMIIFLVAFIILIIIFMSFIEGRIRSRNNEKILWRMEQMDKIDKVETRTGGLENDRLNERQ